MRNVVVSDEVHAFSELTYRYCAPWSTCDYLRSDDTILPYCSTCRMGIGISQCLYVKQQWFSKIEINKNKMTDSIFFECWKSFRKPEESRRPIAKIKTWKSERKNSDWQRIQINERGNYQIKSFRKSATQKWNSILACSRTKYNERNLHWLQSGALGWAVIGNIIHTSHRSLFRELHRGMLTKWDGQDM